MSRSRLSQNGASLQRRRRSTRISRRDSNRRKSVHRSRRRKSVHKSRRRKSVQKSRRRKSVHKSRRRKSVHKSRRRKSVPKSRRSKPVWNSPRRSSEIRIGRIRSYSNAPKRKLDELYGDQTMPEARMLYREQRIGSLHRDENVKEEQKQKF